MIFNSTGETLITYPAATGTLVCLLYNDNLGANPPDATDVIESDLAGTVVNTASMSGVSVTAGVIAAADTTVTSVTGDVNWVIVAIEGAGAIRYLLCAFNAGVSDPAGEDVIVEWDPSGILSVAPC